MILTGKKKWLAIPILLVGLFAFLPIMPEAWFERMHTIKNYEEDASAMGRLDVWKYAIDRAYDNPLTGGGFETFRNYIRDVHSAYFEILGDLCFVVLGLWLSLLFGTMIALQRLRKQALQVEGFSWIPHYAKAIQISLVGYAVGGVFLGTAYWDIFYHLVSFCVVMKVVLHNGIQEGQPAKGVV
jgi:probable O-glycosylation ligase (exosortase A-associated)